MLITTHERTASPPVPVDAAVDVRHGRPGAAPHELHQTLEAAVGVARLHAVLRVGGLRGEPRIVLDPVGHPLPADGVQLQLLRGPAAERVAPAGLVRVNHRLRPDEDAHRLDLPLGQPQADQVLTLPADSDGLDDLPEASEGEVEDVLVSPSVLAGDDVEGAGEGPCEARSCTLGSGSGGSWSWPVF